MKRSSFRRDCREKRRDVRTPYLGNYIIVTNTDCTETNYFNGIKNSLPSIIKDSIKIHIYDNIKSCNLIEYAHKLQIENPQYAKPYIIFDRDQEKEFNGIINSATQNGITPCWSNPCFEIWLYSYFDKMPNIDTSQKCCDEFSRIFLKLTSNKYYKNDKDLYKKLVKYGNETEAIKRANTKFNLDIKKYNNHFNEMIGNSTVFKLVEELKNY